MLNYQTDFLTKKSEVKIAPKTLRGELSVPPNPKGVVLFANGTGCSRLSPRNQTVARILRKAGFGTLLFDLLTEQEEQIDFRTRHLRYDVNLLSGRLLEATDALSQNPELKTLKFGYFGSDTGTAAALIAATHLPERIGGIVSRGGRPDLAGSLLADVVTSTLFLVGENDDPGQTMTKQALAKMTCETELKVLPGAGQRLEEVGALEEAARLAVNWFQARLY